MEIRSLSNAKIETINEIQTTWTALEKDIVNYSDSNGVLAEFFAACRETVTTLKEIVVTRYIEGIESIYEEGQLK